jgi:hypothetical protein
VPEAADGEVHHRAGPGQEPMLGAGLSLVSILGCFYSASSAKYDSQILKESGAEDSFRLLWYV